ncbi:MAG: 3-deoxy-7-phosphoheptulonate synthase, partial [Saprospiraceae bacterium]|nr:3-deoxy-7-phosphoheptulonate synthase [Saprospiraceae bacterium]
MIIQLEETCSATALAAIRRNIERVGYQHNDVITQSGHYLVCIGSGDFDIRSIGALGGIQDIHRVSDAQKLVSAKWKVGRTAVRVAEGVEIGNGHFQFMAGPCSIENAEQVKEVVAHLKDHRIKIMRGGVFKPRTSPYSFRGLGIAGLKVFSEIC